jgi:aspartate racemase
MCTITLHLIADKIKSNLKIPLIHIAEETAKEIFKQKITKVALLGTKFTMENSFFKDKLSGLGIESVIPDREDRDFIHDSIFNELTKGFFKEKTKKKYLGIINIMQRVAIENGHTVEYWNSRDWTGHRCSFLTIDIKGIIELHFFTHNSEPINKYSFNSD